MATVVPCLCWVGKGAAKEVPDKVQLTREEVEELLRGAKHQLSDLRSSAGEEEEEEEGNPLHLRKSGTGQSEQKRPHAGGERASVAERRDGDDEMEEEDVEELYDLASYSDGEDDPREEGGQVDRLGCGFAGLTVFASNIDDPYISLEGAESSEEEEDFKIYPTDNLVCVGKADQDYSSVEVHVYSEKEDHSYCHHEVLLSAFPLTLEWMDFDPDEPKQRGNLLAIGSMEAVVEVWDLDLVDGLEPVVVLGQRGVGQGRGGQHKKAGKKKRSGKEEKGQAVEGHSDAVLGLSWNRLMRSVLASGSADGSVRVWNLQEKKTLLLLPHPDKPTVSSVPSHLPLADKVQCVQWHPYEPQTLVTGCFDRCVRVFDCQAPSDPRVWTLSGEVEKVVWNHFQPESFLASTEDGVVVGLRRDSTAELFTIKAHDQAVSDLTLSCYLPGLLVTVSSDRTLKVWDIHDNKPAFLWTKDLKLGAIFAARFCPDSPLLLAVGGEKDGLRVLSLDRVADIREHFRGRALMQPSLPEEVEQEVVEERSDDVAMETTKKKAKLPASVHSGSSSKAPFKRKRRGTKGGRTKGGKR